MKQLDYSKLIKTEWADQFNDNQIEWIQAGITLGLDVSIYARKEYDHWQMMEIYFGLKYDAIYS